MCVGVLEAMCLQGFKSCVLYFSMKRFIIVFVGAGVFPVPNFGKLKD